jgi:pimeloyl-ACP methyl ester carboxylesterase
MSRDVPRGEEDLRPTQTPQQVAARRDQKRGDVHYVRREEAATGPIICRPKAAMSTFCTNLPYGPSSITSDTLVVRSERDFWSRPEDATAFIYDAVRARSVKLLALADATHFVHLDRAERGRDRLLRELEAFLGDRAPPSRGNRSLSDR